MSSISQSSISASSIARCYRFAVVRRPGDTTRASGAATPSPNSRLHVDMTDSADRNKAASRAMMPVASRPVRARPSEVRGRSVRRCQMSTWYRLVYLGACPLPGTFLLARNRSSRCRLRCAGLPRRRPHVTQRLKEAAEAHGLAAWCQIQPIWNELAELSADLASALAHAKAVMAIRTDDASTLAFAANAYARATRDYDTAIQMTEPALAQNPAMPMRWRWGGGSTPGLDATTSRSVSLRGHYVAVLSIRRGI